jgi:DmsE family decaheme c-type cytochrome
MACGITALVLSVPSSTAWTQVAARQVDWPALNPAFEGATFLNDSRVCQTCHRGVMDAYAETPHARVARAGRMSGQGDCESCHGPRSTHVGRPSRDLAWDALSADQQSAVCMQCHEGGARMSWTGGPHAAADVNCTSCHSVMATHGAPSLLVRQPVQETCYRCHADTRGQMAKPSHHPVREGRMDCASCHNVHGSAPGLVRTTTVTETCVSCHTEKRGPFVWEHAPVRESCASCHEPHGSSNRALLIRKDSFLCLSCHSYGGHVNLPRYNRVSNPYGSGCLNCHISVHGSNHPSGAKLTR